MPYTEEKYENAIIQLFEEMGYTHAYGPAVADGSTLSTQSHAP